MTYLGLWAVKTAKISWKILGSVFGFCGNSWNLNFTPHILETQAS